MSKWLFPLLFLLSMATAHAQPEPPSGPLYDPQGRLIPYDPPSEVNEAPRPASKPQPGAKKKSGKKSAGKSGASKSKKGAAKKSAQGSRKAKSATKPRAAKKKPK